MYCAGAPEGTRALWHALQACVHHAGRLPDSLWKQKQPGRNFVQRQAKFDHVMTATTLSWSSPVGASAGRRKVNLSQVFAGQKIGICEVSERIWLVNFAHYDLGFFDEEADRVECAENPVGARVPPMSPVEHQTCHRNRHAWIGSGVAPCNCGRADGSAARRP